jgi:hypothetical protein
MQIKKEYPYKLLNIQTTAFGKTHCFSGPGISRYTNAIHLLQPFNDWASSQWTEEFSNNDASKIISMLNSAYEEGRQSMSQDIKQLLGIKTY